MFTDPIVIPNGASTTTLPRISLGSSSSMYRTQNEDRTLRVSHQLTNKRRVRRMVRIDSLVMGTSPLDLNVNVLGNVAVYLVIDAPVASEITDINFKIADQVKDLCGFLTNDTAANLTKILGAEV